MAAFDPSQALQLTVLLQVVGGASSIAAATVAFLSWRTVRVSAKAARSSAETALYNSRRQELVRLHEHFESAQLFMKLWQVELATNERALNQDPDVLAALDRRPLAPREIAYKLRGYSSTDPGDTVYVQPFLPTAAASPERTERFAEAFLAHVHRFEAEDVLRQCFGPPYSATSADLLAVYSLVRALDAWVENAEGDRAELISEITDTFRRELVLTLSWHREFVSRLFRGKPSEQSSEYFREHYGLRDDAYTRLMDGLALDADRKGLLTADHRDAIARVETWLAGVPAFSPVRERPFPRPDWIEDREPAAALTGSWTVV